MVAAHLEPGIEKRADVIDPDRAIGDPARGRFDFNQRFEPHHAPGAVADDDNVDTGVMGPFGDCPGHRIGADRDGAGVRWNKDPNAHAPTPPTSRNTLSASVMRPWITPSTATAGDRAQLPRQ